ncbi:radical SAM protein [Sporolactobacillus shoreicorticis]|nr:radical SAM protein [Sporolactobacillus shoreicorticis]MCO7128251.1 radical SAM protein [Sporolactobacillus shoreicorticis]
MNELSNKNDQEENNEFELFAQKGFLIDDKIDEISEERKRRKVRRKCAQKIRKNTIGFMRISLTENCNLRCKYCFVNSIFEKKGKMGRDDLIKIMKWFLEIPNNKQPVIQYFGGEPLLKFNEIMECHSLLQQCKENGQIISFREEIVTNGTLMTKEMAEYFLKNNISISFSIDGWKEINDRNRIDAAGHGSFDRVVKGMITYKAAGGRLGAVVTPTNENMEIFGKIIKYLAENLKCEEISINTPQPTKDGWQVDGRKFAKAMQDCWKYCTEHNITLNHPANNIVFLINSKIPQTNSCMNLTYGEDINTWGIFVTSDARISKCVVECDERCTVNFDEFVMDEEYLKWHFEDDINQNCFKCPGLNICGGGCSIERLLSEGKNNIEKCKFFKTMIPWAIQNMAE